MEYEGIVKEVFIPDSVDTLKTNKIGFKVYVYELDKEITVEELQDEYNINIYKDDNVIVVEDKEEYSIIVYFVKAGDTLWNIAKKFRSTVENIKQINNIEDEDKLAINQQLFIPRYVEKVKAM